MWFRKYVIRTSIGLTALLKNASKLWRSVKDLLYVATGFCLSRNLMTPTQGSCWHLSSRALKRTSNNELTKSAKSLKMGPKISFFYPSLFSGFENSMEYTTNAKTTL